MGHKKKRQKSNNCTQMKEVASTEDDKKSENSDDIKVDSTIYVTTNLNFFKMNVCNRGIKTFNFKKLKKNIKENGQLDEIKVRRDGTIIDGHHRYLAIKELNEEGMHLGIKFSYIDSQLSDAVLMILLNATRKNWTQEDYEIIYSKLDPESFYGKLIKFAEKYKETPSAVIAVITKGSDHGRIGKTIASGEDLGFNDWDSLHEYYKYLKDIKSYVNDTRRFKQTLFRLYSKKNFDKEHFKKAIEREYEKNKERGKGKLLFSSRREECMLALLKINNYKMHNGNSCYIDYDIRPNGVVKLKDEEKPSK